MTDIKLGRPDGRMVWFDLDDTLWNFTANSDIALDDTYRHFDLDRYWPDAQAWKDDYHAINSQLWVEYAAGQIDLTYLRMQRFYRPFVGAGMDNVDATRLAGQADTYYLSQLGKLPGLVPGARNLLQRLRDAGFRTGILSNGFNPVQYNKMASSGISDLIDVVVLSDEIGINKPDRRLYDYAMEKAGTTADRCIMIGDNPDTDIAGAIHAGWNTVVWFNPDNKTPGTPLPHNDATTVFETTNLDKINV